MVLIFHGIIEFIEEEKMKGVLIYIYLNRIPILKLTNILKWKKINTIQDISNNSIKVK